MEDGLELLTEAVEGLVGEDGAQDTPAVLPLLAWPEGQATA